MVWTVSDYQKKLFNIENALYISIDELGFENYGVCLLWKTIEGEFKVRVEQEKSNLVKRVGQANLDIAAQKFGPKIFGQHRGLLAVTNLNLI